MGQGSSSLSGATAVVASGADKLAIPAVGLIYCPLTVLTKCMNITRMPACAAAPAWRENSSAVAASVDYDSTDHAFGERSATALVRLSLLLHQTLRLVAGGYGGQ